MVDDILKSKLFKKLENRTFILTYTSIYFPIHIPKKKILSFFNELAISLDNSVDEIYISHESKPHSFDVDKKPYLHTHVVVKFKKIFKTKNFKIFDINEIHCDISIVNNWIEAVRYLGKEDPDNISLKSYGSEQETSFLLSDKSVKISKKPSNVLRNKKISNNKIQEQNELIDKPNRIWQQKIINLLKTEGDNRSINWILDKEGGKGKSYLTKYLKQIYPKDVWVITLIDKASDTAHNIVSAIKEGWSGKIIIFDFPREYSNNSSIYGIMESIRNGQVTSTKYTGGNVQFNNKHMIVFANFNPDFNSMSLDRWKIIELIQQDKKLFKLLKGPVEANGKLYIWNQTFNSYIDEQNKIITIEELKNLNSIRFIDSKQTILKYLNNDFDEF